MHDLAEQLDHGMQPGLRSHEGPALEGNDPRVGLLECWGDLVVNFVVAGRIEPPQIGDVGGRPVFQIGPRVLRKPFLPALGGDLGVQRVQVVVQPRRDLACRAGAAVALDEKLPEEGQDQRGIAGAQQPPCGVSFPQRVDRRVIHEASVRNPTDRSGSTRGEYPALDVRSSENVGKNQHQDHSGTM